MVDPAKAGLLRALGRVVRGLSLVFWGLALTAVVYLRILQVETAEAPGLQGFVRLAFLAALVVSALIWAGLEQLHAFQSQERIWRRALHRAQFLAVADTGLAPFLFWWHRFPNVPLFAWSIALLFLSSLGLLLQINGVLQRLSAMLPDETLRAETRLFTTFNISFLLLVLAGLAGFFLLSRVAYPPDIVQRGLEVLRAAGVWLALFMVLLPLAMTLALVWKIKEVIFTSLLTAER
jgi:hypothetical protein